ncbi:MAG: hypothetical protein FE834_06025 [Gammaproteobacteria bacterium]|nr:hypothetical protein [Gammaproteobacteria bacterium]
MTGASRYYSNQTLKILFASSGNQCAFPECSKTLTNSSNALDSNICHIEALKPEGKRYNTNMTDKDRNNHSNLILLCPQHHNKVDKADDVEKYTVEVLKEMKQKHEMEVAEKMSPQQKISAIAKVVNKIADIDIDEIQGSEVQFSFKPEDKIKYNNIQRYKSLFENYKIYSTRLNTIYDGMEAGGSIKKNMILRNIQSIYLMAKDRLKTGVENQADNIIEEVKNKLLYKLEDSELDEESISFAVEVILVDAFMRCKILKEPPQ